LVSPEVRLLNPHDKTDTLMGVAEVRAKTGVESTQIVDWLSLIGDSVDNIPGVPGVGPKTATELLRQFGSVDSLYRRLEEVRQERLRSHLCAAVELVIRNQKLVRLNCQESYQSSLEEMVCKPVDPAALRELYLRWGFKSLLRELEESQLAKESLFPETAGAC